jgi:hypothetical protein
MAFVLNDRVKETTTTTGTGTVNLAGAETGFESFVAGIGNSNTTYYAIVHQSLDEFEVGLGTITDATPDTLARTTVISSSNSDSAVNFSAGTKDVFCTLPASKAVVEDANNNITTPNGDNGLGLGTDTVPHGGVGAAKLAIEGSDSNFGAGPHVQFTTTSDDHPLMQILPYAHDNVSISFDAYHNGTNWISSDAGSNFQIYKLNDALNFYYKSGVAAGSTAAPWSSGAYLSATSGYWGIGTGLAMNANTDIVFTDGTWTGEKARKIQAHSGHIYYQSASHIFRNASGTNNFQIDGTNCIATGNITAYGSISDERLKENIEVIENPIDKIKDLKGVTFNYKKDGSKSTGLIAQDLEKVLPEAVYTSKTIGDEINEEESEEHLAIRYGNTVGLLVEAIKEQQEQIETLTAKVKELEDK